MAIKNLDQFHKLLIKNNKSVSNLEYTKNNYDNTGNLIKEALPTLTTNFCEIGLYNNEIYFVFIINSKTFSTKLFDNIKNKSNIRIYSFVNFNKTLYPANNFDLANFIKQIKEDEYLQVQFNYKNINAPDLFKKYSDLVTIFKKSKAVIVNQLKINLNDKQNIL